MEQKGKPQTTSVPSITVRFHANEEQLEELYSQDEDQKGDGTNIEELPSGNSVNDKANEQESSPLKYLPRLVKRSTSIDITPSAQTNLDASPSADPWRFFTDMKGKITKSFEDRITEIKSRNQEETTKSKQADKNSKESKENSSHSDSEEFSDSSISRTCGIVSTTEGAEMSSDEESTSMQKDNKSFSSNVSTMTAGGELRQRFRMFSKSKQPPVEGLMSRQTLSGIYSINGNTETLPPEMEVEKATEALEEPELDKEVLQGIQKDYANITLDKDSVLNVVPITGEEIRNEVENARIVYAPVGFVDMREKETPIKSDIVKPLVFLVIASASYYFLHHYSSYLAGILLGLLLSAIYFGVKSLLNTPLPQFAKTQQQLDFVEVQAVKEYQPIMKYEGWMNELPETYDAHTYHISQTQSIFVRLQGNLLRISNTKAKIPKRALWNESPQIKPIFTNHRVYNLLGAKIAILPEGLAKKRHWSKKYPICISLTRDHVNYDESIMSLPSVKEEQVDDEEPKNVAAAKSSRFSSPRRSFGFRKKKPDAVLAQRYSKLAEENEYELDTDNSGESSPSLSSPDVSGISPIFDEKTAQAVEQALEQNLHSKDDDEVMSHFIMEDECENLPEDLPAYKPEKTSPEDTKLYLFARTGRQKEDWFRRFVSATHKGASTPLNEALDIGVSISDSLVSNAILESEYMKFMLSFNKVQKRSQHPHLSQTRLMSDRLSNERTSGELLEDATNDESHDESRSSLPLSQTCDLQWVNMFCGRILFDCLRDDHFTQQIRDRLQKKLTAIKLPYFIEGLLIKDFNLGSASPLIHRSSKPVIDDRGLWIDLDITYEGMIYLILQTKLNLMKLKYPPPHETSKTTEKSAIYHSDVEDSAESTSDEDNINFIPNNTSALDSSGLPIAGLGGSSNTSKKFIKMVDKIAESRFFQAATEYRYIKKAMEGVSNTDLRLRVEIKELTGTLVLNIPTPPSDRIWVGFRPIPEVALSAQPIVGEKNITFMRITSWIEKKLLLEFQKLLVIPNMEDFIIPVMNPMLPR